VALLVGGVENGQPRLYETDPSGTPYEWKAVSIGADRSDIQEHLEENYDEDLSLDDGVGLALRAIASANDDELEAGGVDVATIEADSASFVEFDNDEIAEYIAANDLEPAEDEDADDDAGE
jgi:proteasome alpha subunit